MTPEEKIPELPRLTFLDLASAFLRTLFLQAVWNFERYLSFGFALVLVPVLRRIYPREERGEALSRHMEYFNTHPFMASFILGAVIRMEEERQQLPKAKQKQKEEEISALKVGMMGPLAAIGDNFFWATLRPYCGLMAVVLVMSQAFQPKGYAWIIPVLFLLVFNATHLGIRLMGFLQGYRKGDQVVLAIRRYGFRRPFGG